MYTNSNALDLSPFQSIASFLSSIKTIATIINKISTDTVVTVKGSCIVRPMERTCAGRLSLQELDLIDNTAHVPTIYFYKPQENWLSQEFLISNTLEDSLSKALVPFYPLAGRLQWIGNGRLELECNDMGVSFIEAESELTLDESGDFSTPNPKFNYLVPTVDYVLPIHELPIALVQLTKFKCGGISIGVHISHVVADGSSAMHFISEWARFSRGKPLATVPFLDRKVLRAGETPLSTAPPFFDQSDLNDLPLLLGQNDNIEERKKETTLVTLKVTKTQVKLKKIANENWDKPNGRDYSRYESLTNHIWRSACKARRHKAEQRTALCVMIDIRRRVKPPLPEGYFGNAIVPGIDISSAGELVSKSLGYVVSRIRKEIEKVTDEYVRSGIEFLKNEQDLTKFQDLHTIGSDEAIFFGNPNLSVVSWITLPVSEFDSGWGKEIYMGEDIMTMTANLIFFQVLKRMVLCLLLSVSRWITWMPSSSIFMKT